MPSMLRACVAWPAIFALAVLFLLIGLIGLCLNRLGGAAIAVAEALRDAIDWMRGRV